MNNRLLSLTLYIHRLSVYLIIAIQSYVISWHIVSSYYDSFIMLFLPISLPFFIGLRWVNLFIWKQNKKAINYYKSLVSGSIRKEIVSLVIRSKLQEEQSSHCSTEDVSTTHIEQYISSTLKALYFDDRDINIVIYYWHQLLQDGISLDRRPHTIPLSRKVSQADLKHFAWNIGEVAGLPGYTRALFAHTVFYEWFRDTRIETTVKTLHDTRGGKRIPLLTMEEIASLKFNNAPRKENDPDSY